MYPAGAMTQYLSHLEPLDFSGARSPVEFRQNKHDARVLYPFPGDACCIARSTHSHKSCAFHSPRRRPRQCAAVPPCPTSAPTPPHGAVLRSACRAGQASARSRRLAALAGVRAITMVAGGTGIAPMFQALCALFGEARAPTSARAKTERPRVERVVLLFGVRSRAELLLREECRKPGPCADMDRVPAQM